MGIDIGDPNAHRAPRAYDELSPPRQRLRLLDGDTAASVDDTARGVGR